MTNLNDRTPESLLEALDECLPYCKDCDSDSDSDATTCPSHVLKTALNVEGFEELSGEFLAQLAVFIRDTEIATELWTRHSERIMSLLQQYNLLDTTTSAVREGFMAGVLAVLSSATVKVTSAGEQGNQTNSTIHGDSKIKSVANKDLGAEGLTKCTEDPGAVCKVATPEG